MKNTFGCSITVTLFGESHGDAIGATLDGIAPGIKVDIDYINKKMELRKPYGSISTSRKEPDEIKFISGVFNGYTTGTPLTVLIFNKNTHSGDYKDLRDVPRPSHADFTANEKYHGFQDYRGGGHFSGRITAALVAVGAILDFALKKKNIYIGTHIKELHGINDRSFADYKSDILTLGETKFPVLNEEVADKMKKHIEEVASVGDSVGGILESAIIGVPAGLGEPWFDTLEGVLAHGLFSIPAIKGVEFGEGFSASKMLGSEFNDSFETNGKQIFTKTNNNGGINGGISNGMPITLRCAVKPTPSIYKKQQSVSLYKMENTDLQIQGRHDPCIIHRARAVVDAILAITVADMLTVKFGTDYLATEKTE